MVASGQSDEGGTGWRDTKGTQETFGGDVSVYYLEYGDGFTGLYISQNIKLYTLNMCSLLYGNCTSIKSVFERKVGIQVVAREWCYSHQLDGGSSGLSQKEFSDSASYACRS